MGPSAFPPRKVFNPILTRATQLQNNHLITNLSSLLSSSLSLSLFERDSGDWLRPRPWLLPAACKFFSFTQASQPVTVPAALSSEILLHLLQYLLAKVSLALFGSSIRCSRQSSIAGPKRGTIGPVDLVSLVHTQRFTYTDLQDLQSLEVIMGRMSSVRAPTMRPL